MTAIEELVETASACLSDGRLSGRAERWDAACEILIRGLPEGAVKPGVILTLSGAEPRDAPDAPARKTVGHVWGVDHHRGDLGYLGVFLNDGAVRVYRIVKYKPIEDGGNDYVLVDAWLPGVFLS